jgi:DNA-binding NtrC family response regulator
MHTMSEPLDEVWKLRGCISDLVSVMALPALWRGGEPPVVVGVLSDVLLRMLKADFVYVQLNQPAGLAPVENLRIAAPDPARQARPAGHGTGHEVAELPVARVMPAADVGRALAPWLAGDAPVTSATVPNPVGSGETTIAVAWLGSDERNGVVVAGSQRGGFPSYIETLLMRVAVNQAVSDLQRAEVVAARRRCGDVEHARELLQAENRYLRHELESSGLHWETILGHCDGLKRVRSQVEQVAGATSCVLVQGERGTGKELVARAVHELGGRRDKPFIRLHCAALAGQRLDAELFGHEQDAFAGAGPARPGCLELAHGGTLFLDDIGELSLDAQARLLRVLQDQTFEHIGGSARLRADVRLVAASGRDLKAMVAEQRFRGDLYYRLNVFPIDLPPLRDRVDDIPVLVRHFAQLHARRCGKQITTIAPQTMSALRRYRWPGNMHELDNLVERSVMLSQGALLEVPLAELALPGETPAAASAVPRYVTLEDAQREHIVRALAASNWVIAGAAGAAAKLGMKRTSLQYKMHKLGITRPQEHGIRTA